MKTDDKIRSMKASEIIMAMVNGLKKEYYEIRMGTYGSMGLGDICYACAATNCVTEISGVKIDQSVIELQHNNYSLVESAVDPNFMLQFESSIDALRKGLIVAYNNYAGYNGYSKIKSVNFYLPLLEDDNWKENLHYYEELADLEAALGN